MEETFVRPRRRWGGWY